MVHFLSTAKRLSKSKIVTNTLFGIFANAIQVLFASGLFVLMARVYEINDFGKFLLATTVYQLVAAFSSMGLGQWFVREYSRETRNANLTRNFLKTQFLLGVVFYIFNIITAFLLYPSDEKIQLLSVVLGLNVFFDNVILALRSLNVAEAKQYRTATVQLIDGTLKFSIAGLLLFFPMNIVFLSGTLVFVRLLTLFGAFKINYSARIALKNFWKIPLSMAIVKETILNNWYFAVIGSVSMIYWRLSHVLVSKILTIKDVAHFEVAYRLFSLVLIIPVIASGTVFPKFVTYQNDIKQLKQLYQRVFASYVLFSVLCYGFVASFSSAFVPAIFGEQYTEAVECINGMFITALLLPTVILQANLIVATNGEKIDMVFNILSLVVNICVAFAGLAFYKSLAVVNYSILLSFVIFHFAQDWYLIKKFIASLKSCLTFYVGLVLFYFSYHKALDLLGNFIAFGFLCFVVIAIAFFAITKSFSSRKLSKFTVS